MHSEAHFIKVFNLLIHSGLKKKKFNKKGGGSQKGRGRDEKLVSFLTRPKMVNNIVIICMYEPKSISLPVTHCFRHNIFDDKLTHNK